MALALRELPKYLVLEPAKGVRLDLELAEAACEIDLGLDSPRPGRSFVVLVGHIGGPIVQRARIAGSARLFFAPEKAGEYVLYLTNPMDEAAVVRLAARDVVWGKSRRGGTTRRRIVTVGLPRVTVRAGPRRASRPRRRPAARRRPSRSRVPRSSGRTGAH